MTNQHDTMRDPGQQPAEEYGVLETTDTRPHEFPFDTRGRRAAIGQAADAGGQRARDLPASAHLPLPRWPLLAGVFNFPWQRGVRTRWLGLSLGLLVPLGFASVVVWLGGVDFIFFPTACVSSLIWGAVAFSNAVAIVRDTAAGNLRVENWPEGLFLNWIDESLYVFNSLLVLIVVLGLGILFFAQPRDTITNLVMLASVLVLFPIVLLSMLETDSPLNPLSLPTWRSLLTAWWAWGLFYIESIPLSIAVGGLLPACVSVLGWLAIPVVAVVFVGAMMIYFRLLGRLALCCAAASRQDQRRGEHGP